MLLILAFLLIVSFVLNFFLRKNTAFLISEYVFSFDYPGHLKNIINDFRLSKEKLLETNVCNDCPHFYHYSRWYSLVVFGLLSLGRFLHLHPLIFYVFLSVGGLVTSLYFFSRILLGRVDYFPFLVASTVFILFPQRFLSLGDGSNIVYFLLIFSLSLIFYSLREINNSTNSKILKLGMISGLFSSSFLNIGIGYLPIFLYSSFLIFLFFVKNILKDMKKTFLFLTVMTAIFVGLNLPIFLSLVIKGNSRFFSNFLKLSLIESLTARLSMASENFNNLSPAYVILFFCLILVLFLRSTLSLKNKIILSSVYFFVTVLLTGGVIYEFIFRNHLL